MPALQEGQTVKIDGRNFVVERRWAKEVLLHASKTRKLPEVRMVRRISTVEKALAGSSEPKKLPLPPRLAESPKAKAPA